MPIYVVRTHNVSISPIKKNNDDAHAIFSRVQSARVTGYEGAAGCEGHSGEPGHDRASSALPYEERPVVLSSRGSLH